ncbi:MAG TPA: serine protease [Croceibacterium sp.]|nr:serine protease [Croceibacterium sp.]
MLLRLSSLLALLSVFWASAALADPADIAAASRGVVRIVIIERDGETLVPIAHGTGFAVGPDRVVTNAHVVQEARDDNRLLIGIVPSDGEDAVYGRLVATSPRNDLALVAATAPMRLPVLTIAGTPPVDSGAVTAVGYPMNVDRAQGLSSGDIFRAQPPVTSTGFLSGRRPTREFDSLLHTAPIARGSSGGPLLDDCGRVVGVNSFGTESGSADAEFFFAVSTRELLPFLRANGVTPQVNGLPCRSLADLEAQERARAERQQLQAETRAAADEQAMALRREETRRGIEFALLAEREADMALTMVLLMSALAASGLAIHAHHIGLRHNAEVGFGLAALALAGSAAAWLSRPGFDQVEERLEQALREEMTAEDTGRIVAPTSGQLICVLDTQRSRAVGEVAPDVPFEWSDTGCVNARTQYGPAQGAWSRVLVPADEEAVSVNSFDPSTREYRVERYLLDRTSMERARTARAEIQAPACGADEAAINDFGARQAAILSLLPDRPNERLIYTCSPRGG